MPTRYEEATIKLGRLRGEMALAIVTIDTEKYQEVYEALDQFIAAPPPIDLEQPSLTDEALAIQSKANSFFHNAALEAFQTIATDMHAVKTAIAQAAEGEQALLGTVIAGELAKAVTLLEIMKEAYEKGTQAENVVDAIKIAIEAAQEAKEKVEQQNNG